MSEKQEEIAILVCGDRVSPLVEEITGQKAEWANCAKCGMNICFTHDPDVPENHIKMCFSCAMATCNGQPEEVIITRKNQETAKALGYKLHTEGNA